MFQKLPWRRRRRIIEQWQSSGRFKSRRNTEVEDEGPSLGEVLEEPCQDLQHHVVLEVTPDTPHDPCHPIFTAVQANDSDAVRIIIQEDSTVIGNVEYEGMTVLHAACIAKNTSILEILLNGGAPIQSLDRQGNTALHLAVHNSWHEGIERLLVAGALVDALSHPPPDSDRMMQTPLHVAVSMGDLKALNLMLPYKPDFGILDGNNNSLLHMATQAHNADIINLLLQNNVVLETLQGKDSEANSILHTILLESHEKAEESNIIEMFNIFADIGLDVNSVNTYGETLLYLAGRFGFPKVVQWLLSKGADPTRLNAKGQSALHAACHRGCAACVELLLKTDKMRFLLTKPDKNGREPFHYAVRSCSMECCELLLKNGDHLTNKDIDGVSRANLILENLPSAKDVFSHLFDSKVKIPNSFRRDPDFHISFDYSILLPVDDDIQTSLIHEIDDGESESLLKHPLVESFIHKKWKRVKFFFYGNVFTFFIFLLIHTSYIDSIFKTTPTKFTLIRHVAFRVIHICTYLLVLIPEIINFCGHPKKYLKHWESLTKLTCLASSGFIVFSLLKFSEKAYEELKSARVEDSVYRNTAAVSVFACWAEFMMLLGRFPALGIYILMFSRIAKSLVYFIMAFSSLVIGFSLSFRVLFYEDEHFQSFITSMVRTLMMMIGEIDYGELVDKETPLICYIILVLFVFLVCVLMANLLIGLAVDDISKLQNLGRIGRLSKQAAYIATYEKLTLLAKKTHIIPSGLIMKFEKVSRVKPRCNIFLNRKRVRMLFNIHVLPIHVVEAAIAIGHTEGVLPDADQSVKIDKLGIILQKLEEMEKTIHTFVNNNDLK